MQHFSESVGGKQLCAAVSQKTINISNAINILRQVQLLTDENQQAIIEYGDNAKEILNVFVLLYSNQILTAKNVHTILKCIDKVQSRSDNL